jgi:hypothetical protein
VLCIGWLANPEIGRRSFKVHESNSKVGQRTLKVSWRIVEVHHCKPELDECSAGVRRCNPEVGWPILRPGGATPKLASQSLDSAAAVLKWARAL